MRRYWLFVGILVGIGGLAFAEELEGPSKWEKTITNYEDRDAKALPPEGAILFVGSSSIRFWKTWESFPEFTTINRGFGGSQMSDLIHFYDRIVVKYKPRQIVFYEGDNDLDSGKSPDEVMADYQTFIDRVHEDLPATRLAFIAIKPSLARWELVETMRAVNARVAALAESDPLLDYIDIDTPMLGEDGKPREELFIKDGLHLNPDGYALWASIVRPFLTPDPVKAP